LSQVSVFIAMIPIASRAAACVNGVYRAGCAGPNGAAKPKDNLPNIANEVSVAL
jgi:hypothetical protein